MPDLETLLDNLLATATGKAAPITGTTPVPVINRCSQCRVPLPLGKSHANLLDCVHNFQHEWFTRTGDADILQPKAPPPPTPAQVAAMMRTAKERDARARTARLAARRNPRNVYSV